ncbi:unnamed protein product, partial [Allacma fusca]
PLLLSGEVMGVKTVPLENWVNNPPAPGRQKNSILRGEELSMEGVRDGLNCLNFQHLCLSHMSSHPRSSPQHPTKSMGQKPRDRRDLDQGDDMERS